MKNNSNYYDLLGIPRKATSYEIRRAYREASRLLHPDVNKRPGETELFLDIQQAYEILSDDHKKAVYDAELNSQRDEPIGFDIQCSASTLPLIGEPQIVYILLDIVARGRNLSKQSVPLNLCLILDRSTSMQSERMDKVKDAAIELVRQLSPEDFFSIVVFNDRANTLLPAESHVNQANVETLIHMIRSEGGTEIFQGLEAGFKEIIKNASKSLINHMILITDGRTYGDEDLSLMLGEEVASHGITITGLGIGTEWNDNFMDRLSSITGGTTYFISRAKDLRCFLQEKIDSLKQTFAENLTIKWETDPGITLNSVFRLHPEPAALIPSPTLRLGSLSKKGNLSILLEFIIQPIPEGISQVTIVQGDLQLNLPHEAYLPTKIPIKISRFVGGEPYDTKPSTSILKAVAQVTLYHMQERARQDISDGKIEAASTRLHRFASQLQKYGESELAETAHYEAERIKQKNLISPEGEKAIKYGTRKLFLPVGDIKENG